MQSPVHAGDLTDSFPWKLLKVYKSSELFRPHRKHENAYCNQRIVGFHSCREGVRKFEPYAKVVGCTFSHKMPPGSIQWVGIGPTSDILAISLTSAILKRVCRTEFQLGVKLWEDIYVALPSERQLRMGKNPRTVVRAYVNASIISNVYGQMQ